MTGISRMAQARKALVKRAKKESPEVREAAELLSMTLQSYEDAPNSEAIRWALDRQMDRLAEKIREAK